MRVFRFTVLLASIASAAWAGGPLQFVPLDDTWKLESKGSWNIRRDSRDLFAMQHPWEVSEEGGYAQASRMVSVPPDWTAPLYLSFYCSDDYHTDSWRPDGSTLTAEGFVGHRFKQVFINEQIVWSTDVSDPVVQGESPVHRVRIDAQPGSTFRLAFVVFDLVRSTEVLSRDFFQSSEGKTERGSDQASFRFISNVYWGDVTLCAGDTMAPVGKRPNEARVLQHHESAWPIAPTTSEAAKANAISLDVGGAQALPAVGFPIRIGIPFAPGRCSDTRQLRLLDSKGKSIYAEKEVLARWQDDSVRWCLVDAVLPNPLEEVKLEFKKDTAELRRKATLREEDGAVRMDASSIAMTASPGRLLHDIKSSTGATIEEVSLVLHSGADRYPGVATRVGVVDDGPLRVTAVLEGECRSPEKMVARFHLYATVWSGLPYVSFWLRLFNDGDTDLAVTELAVTLKSANLGDMDFLAGESVGSVWRLVQDSATQRSLQVEKQVIAEGSGEMVRVTESKELDPSAPLSATMGSVAVTMPRMRERFPKGIQRRAGSVSLRLIDAPRAPIVLTPGEANSHEFWLAFGEVDAAAFAQSVEHPPVLSNPEYFCATGAFGPAFPVLGIPKYDQKMGEVYGGKDWGALGHAYGVRDFPDSPYFSTAGNWSNNYYNRTHGAWAAWLATGAPEWFERSVDVCRLVNDVAVIHAEVPGKDWYGAIHGPGKNHVPGPWSPTLRTRGLWLDSMLTGAYEVEAAYLSASDFVARTGAHKDSPSVRDHAGPMDAIVTAYDATREPGFLDEGSKRVSWAWSRMDRRRGVWPETHGSMVYRGNVPWMVAQLAGPMYEWYRLTGDTEAAQLVVAMAESMILENTPWNDLGQMSGYSHNPHFATSAAYDPLILPILFAAYEMTGDETFLAAAKAQWERWNSDPVFDSVFNTFWHTPWLGYYLKQYVPQAFALAEDEATIPAEPAP